MNGSVPTGKERTMIMAKLPDGWIFIPRTKDAVTIEVEERELVMCRNCKHVLPNGFCHKHSKKVTDEFYCADGEGRETGGREQGKT